MQYVGYIFQKSNKRFNWHRNGFSQPGKYGLCCILSDNFLKVVFCNGSYSVQILIKLEGSVNTARNALDASITCKMK